MELLQARAAARDQVRRLSHARAYDRRSRHQAAHAHRPQLVGSLSARHRGAAVAEGEVGPYRRRALRPQARRRPGVQPLPGGHGRGPPGKEIGGLRYTDHVVGDGPRFRQHAYKLGLEGAISKRADQPYAPGDRGIWVKSKSCTARSSSSSAGPIRRGAVLISARCFSATTPNRLHYAGRAGTGIAVKALRRLADILAPLRVAKMPLVEPPPRDSRFGSPLQFSTVHWVRPELIVEVTYLTWTDDNLLRQVSYQGRREDTMACQVAWQIPHPLREPYSPPCVPIGSRNCHHQ